MKKAWVRVINLFSSDLSMYLLRPRIHLPRIQNVSEDDVTIMRDFNVVLIIH